MKNQSAVIVALCSLFFGVLCAQSDPDSRDWIPLFNGNNLDGWDLKISGYDLNENYGNTFRVENGVLKVAYDGYGEFGNRFGHIFYREPYSYYRLRLEYRFLGDQVPGSPDWAFRNSGVMIHSQSAESMLRDQDFPISIEVQLLGGAASGERSTANLCTPGTNVEMNGKLVTDHCVQSSSKTYRGDQWVHVEVSVLGSREIRHEVEGEKVLAYEKPQIGGGNVHNFDEGLFHEGELLESGYISLQSESHPVEFRNVELLNLVGCTEPGASNYKSYYVKADNSKCRYD